MSSVGTFENSFRQFVKDGVLDKNEFNKLKQLAKTPNLDDKSVAEEMVGALGRYTDSKKIEYEIGDSKNKKVEVLSFDFTPNYNEEDKIEGSTPFEIVSNISQSDTLAETRNDDNRCNASSLLNAYLLMDGKFDSLAKKFGVGTDLTYKNVHLLQEKIYNLGNTDGRDGISSGFEYNYTLSTGKITKSTLKGELPVLLDKLGFKTVLIHGDNLKTITHNKSAVDNFFKENPKGVLDVGVYMTKNDSLISANKLGSNHTVLVFKKDNDFYLVDTGKGGNANRNHIKKLSNEEMNNLVYNTKGVINGLTLNK